MEMGWKTSRFEAMTLVVEVVILCRMEMGWKGFAFIAMAMACTS